MTSTPFNIGLSDNTRSSSRVLRPPGGGHTDIFGGEAEPQRGRRPAPAVLAAQAEAAAVRSQTINGTADSQPAQPHHEPAQNGHQTPDAPEPQSQPQTPPEPKVVTPPSKQEIQPEPVRAEPPKRVRVPPGGFSSGLW